MGMIRLVGASLAILLLSSCAERELRFQPSTISTADYWGLKSPPDVFFGRFDRSPPNPGGIQFACAAGVLSRRQLTAILDLNGFPDELDPGSYSEFGFKHCVPDYRNLCDDPKAFELYVKDDMSIVACSFGGAMLVKVGIRTYG